MQTGKAKAEARIEALREGGVEVDVWLNSANADTAMDEDDNCDGNATVTGATRVCDLQFDPVSCFRIMFGTLDIHYGQKLQLTGFRSQSQLPLTRDHLPGQVI